MQTISFIINTMMDWWIKGEFFKFMLPLYVGMILTERFIYLFSRQRWDAKDSFANIAISTFNMVYSIVIGIVIPLSIMDWLYNHARLFTLPNTFLGFCIGFLIHDLFYYIDHYVAHRTGLFWAFHQVHHSSEEFNFTVAARGFFADGTITQPIYYLMPVVGMSPNQIGGVLIIASLYGIFNHTRLVKRMGFLEYILATPSNHRVHHGANPKYLDKNYGQTFIIWDLIFGTYKREEEEPTYGLTTNINSYNPVEIQTSGVKWLWHQMKSSAMLSDKLKYLYMPPGWKHDGTGLTSKDLLAKWQEEQKVKNEIVFTNQ